MNFILREVLLEPKNIIDLDENHYNQLIPQARGTNLLAALASLFDFEGLLDHAPSRVRRHLDSALTVHEKQKRDVAYDLRHIRAALDDSGTKLVLLKGGAYIQAGINAGRGRLVSDIDIIVPKKDIEAVESALNRAGWVSGEIDPYDNRYYRQWMHEIPPLGNPKRGSTIDLHHTILPPTAKANLCPDLLFESLIEVQPGIYTLSWKDMVIHSATHLFHEGEFHSGLRDLWDLDRMLRQFPDLDPTFWQDIVARARRLDLLDSLFYGLSYAQKVFATPIPNHVMHEANNLPRSLRSPFMDFLFLRAFRPTQPECQRSFTNLALNLLYVRSHYLRMPLHLLVPHLLRKSWRKQFGNAESAQNEPVQIPDVR
jgi:hypothetical protein